MFSKRKYEKTSPSINKKSTKSVEQNQKEVENLKQIGNRAIQYSAASQSTLNNRDYNGLIN
ncbi:Uncharacterised protein [Legionella busanensis]|uniref:Uncharacterized protein n=1 Tax=Legionella busanensis TaxID=190655 RepID=A0A378K8X7_9GAMM|nr:hypothetical protein [Legionella busanensis]STX81398.1 Uncharacterised protein [Legionella busanensis]